MFHPLVISRLVESGFSIYLPLDGSNELYIRSKAISSLDPPTRCKITIATASKDSNPIARVHNDKAQIAVLDLVTETVWLFPPGYCEDRINIRLGKETEQFVLPEPSSLSFIEQKEKRTSRLTSLKAQAKKMILDKRNISTEAFLPGDIT